MDTRDQADWSVGLGRWAGASFSIHLFFAAFVCITFGLAWYVSSGQYETPLAGFALAIAGLGILLVSLFFHEFGHFVACHRVGGHISSVTLMPWGGMNSAYVPSVHGQLIVYLAGPLANLALCVICLITLNAGLNQSLDWQFFHPLRPPMSMDDATGLVALKFFFWVNWLLFLVNLLPGLPFDGGHVVPAVIRTLWRSATNDQVVRLASMVTWTTATLLMAAAFILVTRTSTDFILTSLALIPLAVTLFFSARLYVKDSGKPREEDWSFNESLIQEIDEHRSYFVEDYYDEDDDEDSISDWLQERQQDRERTARRVELEEEQRVDEILAKVHQLGIESLSEEDRALLLKVSARYRRRQREEA